MQAVILAGGEGSRVRPLTRSEPKVMIRVGNRPIIDYVIESVVKCGIRDIIVVAGYRHEQLIRYLNTLDTKAEIRVVVQKKQTGAVDALLCAKDMIDGDFLLLPGDNYINYESLSKIAGLKNAMLVSKHPYPSNYGVVTLKGDIVAKIEEKPDVSGEMNVSTGIFSFEKEIFGKIGNCSIPEYITHIAQSGAEIKAVNVTGWHDSIYSWDLLKMNRLVLKSTVKSVSGDVSGLASLTGNISIGKGTVISPYAVISGNCIIGENCIIGPHTYIGPDTSIGSRVTIEPFTYVSDSIIMDDVKIGSHSRIEGAVIGKGSRVGSNNAVIASDDAVAADGRYFNAHFGAVLGENVKTAPFTVLEHCVVGNSCSIEEGRRITGSLPDNSIVR